MTDINKHIEEESNYPSFQSIRDEGANRAVEMKSYVDRVIGREFFEFGTKWMLEKWKHSSRWRKVSDELPPIGTQVLVKTSNGKFSISEMYIPKDCNGSILGDIEWKGSFSFKSSIIEWKYIN